MGKIATVGLRAICVFTMVPGLVAGGMFGIVPAAGSIIAAPAVLLGSAHLLGPVLLGPERALGRAHFRAPLEAPAAAEMPATEMAAAAREAIGREAAHGSE
jgi:hypothetical protein